MMAPETVVPVDHNKPASTQAPPQQGGNLDWITLNTVYFKTPPGLLKIVELLLGVLCMALASAWYSAWFVFVAVTSFITTVLWTFIYFFSIKEALSTRVPINWVLSELISTSLQAFLYLTAMIALFIATTQYDAQLYGRNVAAAVFGLFNTIAYGLSALMLFGEHRNNPATAAA